MEEVTASCSCFNLLTNTCLNYALYYVTFFFVVVLIAAIVGHCYLSVLAQCH